MPRIAPFSGNLNAGALQTAAEMRHDGGEGLPPRVRDRLRALQARAASKEKAFQGFVESLIIV